MFARTRVLALGLVATLALVGAIVVTTPAAAKTTWHCIRTFGSHSSDPSPGTFQRPHRIACTGSRIFVLQNQPVTIEVFGSDGAWQESWAGGESNKFPSTQTLAVSNLKVADIAVPPGSSSEVYVLEDYRVTVWGLDGTFKRQFGGDVLGGDNQGVSIDVDSAGGVWVGGPTGVWKFSREGVLQAQWGALDGAHGLDGLVGIAVSPDGSSVYTLHDPLSGQHKVQKFTAQGKFVKSWGTSADSASGEIQGPAAIDVGGSGRVYVADYEKHEVMVFNTDGALLSHFGSYGDGAGQNNTLTDVDSACTLDADLYRVQIWNATSEGHPGILSAPYPTPATPKSGRSFWLNGKIPEHDVSVKVKLFFQERVKNKKGQWTWVDAGGPITITIAAHGVGYKTSIRIAGVKARREFRVHATHTCKLGTMASKSTYFWVNPK